MANTFLLPEGVDELRPGLYRFGGSVANDGWLTWAPARQGGYAVYNCYALAEPGHVVVIGTGPAAFAAHTAASVKSLAAGKKLSLVVLRNEPETLGGLSRIIGEVVPDDYYYIGAGGILDWIEDPRPEKARQPALRDLLPMIVPETGKPITIAPGREMIFLVAPFRTMGLWWVYDARTKALFTEDTFCHVNLPSLDVSVPLKEDTEINVETIMEYLLLRADWLAGGNVDGIVESMRQLFHDYPVEILCPARGRPIVGADLVRKHVALTLQAFERCAALEDRVPR